MQITIWGCRGSIPSPSPETLRYGGNTTCVELRLANDNLLIIDAGSGIRVLGNAIRKNPDISEMWLLLTHSHWDHLMGFPFFTPAYNPKYTINICGGGFAQDSITRFLAHQMQAPYFPVDFNVMRANFQMKGSFDQAAYFGDTCFHSIPLNHPNGGYGFKFVEEGRSFVFIPDNELSHAHPDGPPRADFVEFCRDVDLLIHDAQYTQSDYQTKKGWGHSTYEDTVDLAIDAGVKQLGLFHHDPDRTDDQVDTQLHFCRQRIEKAGAKLDCFACAEGLKLTV